MGRLEGKVAIITGGGAGMGRIGSLLFAGEGARVVIADIDVAAGESTVDEIQRAGGEAIFVRTDVSSNTDVETVIRTCEERFGALHVLYNNAGVMLSADGDPVATPEEIWARTLAINLTGVFLCCKHGIPLMLRSGGGSIINVASFVAHMGAATPQVAYTASKGGVLALTREVAAVYARQGIRANALCPGPVLTPLLAAFLSDDTKRERRLVHVPMGRFGLEEEIVRGALFLASDESSYMTGTSLVIEGGSTAAYTTPE
jgi:NAD(P)-dependent dehydrogenase (short-subunit alcohol dehydrogenase family)